MPGRAEKAGRVEKAGRGAETDQAETRQPAHHIKKAEEGILNG